MVPLFRGRNGRPDPMSNCEGRTGAHRGSSQIQIFCFLVRAKIDTFVKNIKMHTIAETSFSFPGQTGVYHGKVRDVYDIGDKLVMVASDRISAFDQFCTMRSLTKDKC